MRRFLLLFFLGVLLASAVTSFAQTFGHITGMVTDTTGGVLVGATVTVTNTQTGATVTQQANSTGLYVFPNLLPGIFDVTVELDGFRSAARNRIELQIVIDTSAVKNLHLGPTNVQFRIEPFNQLNQPNSATRTRTWRIATGTSPARTASRRRAAARSGPSTRREPRCRCGSCG